MSLDKLLKQWNAGEPPDERDIAELIELAQIEIDRIEALIEELPPADTRVIIQVDGAEQKLRLRDAAHLAEYLTRQA